MNTHLSKLIALIYFPVSTRDWSQRIALLTLLVLCLVFIIPNASAEQSANTDSEAVKKQLTAIKISDITGQAEKIQDHLQRVETELSETDTKELAREALDKFNKEINTMQANLDSSLSTRFDKYEIQELDSSFRQIRNSGT
jgi:septal ring factor EnvC (AmiA/AmiB activator)